MKLDNTICDFQSDKEKMGLSKLSNVFTKQGVAMLSSVLKSEIAIEVNV